MDEEQLVLVDEDDNQVGTAGKLECHTGAGRLHRAFTALVFDGSDRLLLARRSDSKMLWPGVWDATFASHPRVSESYADSVVRRMPEELGTVCGIDYLLKFVYHVRYGDVGSENEVCGVLAGILDDPSTPRPAPDEISEVAWVTADDALGDIRKDAMSYCPWMLAAMLLLDRAAGSDGYPRLAGAIAPWTSQGAKDILAGAVRAHMDDSQWRYVR